MKEPSGTRFFTLDVSDLRIEGDEKNPKLVGYAAVFNSPSVPMTTPGGKKIVEKILPGAFKDSLAGSGDVRATILHNQERVFGRKSKGHIRLEEDAKGLRAEISPIDSSDGHDAIEMVRSGVLDRMSFGFKGMDADLKRCEDGTYQRTIKRVIGLKEVTLADDRAAYPDTEVELRMIDDQIKEHERATVTVDDNSLACSCRYALDPLRRAFDVCNNLIDYASRVTGDLNEDDQRAIDDQLTALVAKARDARAILSQAGAEEEPDEADLEAEADAQRMLDELEHRAQLGDGVSDQIRTVMEGQRSRRQQRMKQRAMSLNKDAVSHVKQLIEAGEVDHGAWDESKVDRDKQAAKSFLGIDTSEKPDTAAHWKFPVVAGGKVNRKALGSAAAYAKKNGYSSIAAAATRLGELADAKKSDKK